MLSERNLLTTDFILAKARCRVKRPWSVSLPRFHIFSARKNYFSQAGMLSS